MKPRVIPVGTSEPQDVRLTDDGAAFDGTTFTVTIEIFMKDGADAVAVDTPPAAAWLSASAGTVRVSGCEVLEVGNYYVRFRVRDYFGVTAFFPNGGTAVLWRIVPLVP